jgi:hypothetical protein
MRRNQLFCGLLVAALASSACDCDSGIAAVDPALGNLPDELSFGLVAVGDTFSQTLQIESVSGAPLQLVSVRLEESDVPFTLDAAVPAVVPPMGRVELSLTFAPPAVDTFVATLVVQTDDPDTARGNRRIVLSGSGKSPRISVGPEALNLSAIACPATARSERCSDTEEVTIENVGEVRLTLDRVELAPKPGGVLPPGLALAREVSTSALEPGQKLAVPIRWKPSAALDLGPTGNFEADLVIPSNDPERPRLLVPIVAHADPNGPPVACAQVLEITRRAYVVNNGQVSVTTVGVPAAEYTCTDPVTQQCVAGELQVRPGMTVTLTGEPCSVDPEGDTISYRWSIPSRPADSRAKPSPDALKQTSIEIDAVGRYEVKLVVADSLNLTGEAQLVLNAIPRDDISVQLSWADAAAQSADLDLHLMVDAGPGVSGPATPFCEQDCFWQNPMPAWLEPGPNDDPRLLLDDQGSKAQLETITLAQAPQGSRYRVAVHDYEHTTGAAGLTPSVTIRLKGAIFGPFRPTSAISGTMTRGTGDLWEVATIDFTDPAAPTATALDRVTRNVVASDVGVCP